MFLVRNDPAYVVSPDPASHFYGGHWKYITSMLLDPLQDSVTSVWNFEIPADNYFNATICEPNCGLQALRINYGYGEYAISPCTSSPLWVSHARTSQTCLAPVIRLTCILALRELHLPTSTT